jgi:hypothetical protein
MRTPFDPHGYIRHLDDGSEYLDLKWRLVWLRSDYPAAQVQTQLIGGSTEAVICRAEISLPEGAVGSGHGSGATVEEAENRALGRALAALGIGTEYQEEDFLDERPNLPPPVPLMRARALTERDAEPAESSEEDVPSPPVPTAPTGIGADKPEPSDVNWTKFWQWARPRGYRSAQELSQLLGIDVQAHTPAEVRRLIARYELDHPPGGEEE